MIVVGIALVWAGYASGFWGFCLVKGYDVSFKELMSPTGWYRGSWPPGTAPDNVILPVGGTAQNQEGAAPKGAPNPIQKSAGSGRNQTPAGGGLPVQH